MKKRLISLVAAAALVGGVAIAGAPQVAKAGTVSVKGDTQVTMYGFTWVEYGWTNKVAPGYAGSTGADFANMPMPEDYPDYNVKKKTSAYADAWVTRIGFTFKNEDAGLTGRIEGGFFHATNFRLRRAYVEHHFDNFYVLLGQEWILEEMFSSISAGFTGPAGFDESILRVPQVRVGTKLDLGSASADLALAFEYEGGSAVSDGGVAVNGYAPASVNRVTFTTVAARAILHFDTGFGAPARFYAWGAVIPVYLSANANYTDESKTSYAFGTGIKVPVSMFTIGGNLEYSYGATNYAGLSSYQPASYYVNANGDDSATKMLALNVNLTVAPMPCITVGGEFDYVKFKNDDVFGGTKPNVKTFVGNVKIKTTKYTCLTLEWRHFKAKNFDATGMTTDDSFSGDQYYALYMYKF